MHEPLISTRPYLVRAIYQWIEDNHLTPYVLVDAMLPDVDVPQEYIRNGRIVLNISSMAVRNIDMKNEHIAFSARFGGVARDLFIPIEAILAIYAKENGKGLYFEQDGDIEPPPNGGKPKMSVSTTAPGSVSIKKANKKARPQLKVIK